LTLLAFTQANLVGWICLFVGLAVLLAGVLTGLKQTALTSAPQAAGKADEKLAEAKQQIDATKQHIDEVQSAVNAASTGNLEATTTSVAAATGQAGQAADAAKSALEQVQGIVAALPENLRFAGLLILVGTVLMGVATIQFGGVALF
jgi:hypothetical protein